ncbi:MAG: NUDIX domain-containing protein [Ferruginibacter sp.]|nr:NUDIX domain-containing protein [Ferruginibacter sp.]
MLLKIFINDKPVYLTNTLTENLIILTEQKDVLFLQNEKVNASTFLENINKVNISAAIVYGKNFTSLKKDFFAQFKIIEAGGGIVLNESKELLFIFRNGKWDLPKGKIESNETIETCAKREVEEETGVKNLQLKKKIGETYHIYIEKNIPILKISHWFYFTSVNSKNTIPQIEEGITEVKWITTKNIKEPMANTYQNIKEILSVFFDTP